MAHCVVSRSLNSTDDHYARLLTALGEPITVCLVHCHYQPCPADGQPAVPAALHTDDHVGKVPAVAEWATRTARQRPPVIHQGSLACTAPAHETDGVLCWCHPEVIPPTGDPT